MLSEAVDRYIALRRTLGDKLRRPARQLRAYADYAASRGETYIQTASVLAWATAAGRTPEARAERFRNLALFALFLHAEDSRHQLPPRNPFPIRKTRPVPYIYTPDEIARILDAAGMLRRQRPNPLRRELYITMFGLIAATGLRVSEAIALRVEDVWPDGALHIRETKFCKSGSFRCTRPASRRLVAIWRRGVASPPTATASSRRRGAARSAQAPSITPFAVSCGARTSHPAAAASRVSTIFGIRSRPRCSRNAAPSVARSPATSSPSQPTSAMPTFGTPTGTCKRRPK